MLVLRSRRFGRAQGARSFPGAVTHGVKRTDEPSGPAREGLVPTRFRPVGLEVAFMRVGLWQPLTLSVLICLITGCLSRDGAHDARASTPSDSCMLADNEGADTSECLADPQIFSRTRHRGGGEHDSSEVPSFVRTDRRTAEPRGRAATSSWKLELATSRARPSEASAFAETRSFIGAPPETRPTPPDPSPEEKASLLAEFALAVAKIRAEEPENAVVASTAAVCKLEDEIRATQKQIRQAPAKDRPVLDAAIASKRKHILERRLDLKGKHGREMASCASVKTVMECAVAMQCSYEKMLEGACRPTGCAPDTIEQVLLWQVSENELWGFDAVGTVKMWQDLRVTFLDGHVKGNAFMAALLMEDSAGKAHRVSSIAQVQVSNGEGDIGKWDLERMSCDGTVPPQGRLKCIVAHRFPKRPKQVTIALDGGMGAEPVFFKYKVPRR
jgi:hypothetical protein